jgi:HTH-type transcriptional regulator/antitoxin HigA
MKKITENIHDFEVQPTHSPSKTARELYDNFLTFRNTFDQLPQAELVKRGWIERAGDYSSMLPLMKEINSGRQNVLYRRADNANDALCTAWVSIVTMKAKISSILEPTTNFEGIDKDYLKYVARLSVDETIPINLPDILREKGIILVYEPSLPRMKLDGVVFKLKSGNPVIGHSFRYPRLDNFWFTLMHELAHIVLHLDDLETPIYEDLEIENNDIKELQANRLAKSSFVSRNEWRSCEPKYDKNNEVLIDFAEKQGVHPAIIAGMLRNEENNYTLYNDIINGVDIRKMVLNND